jgi:hypothetical protein
MPPFWNQRSVAAEFGGMLRPAVRASKLSDVREVRVARYWITIFGARRCCSLSASSILAATFSAMAR